jgi:hypothetical protein
MKNHSWILGLALVAFLAGCAQPPKTEIDAAEAAVAQAAGSPEVALYAPKDLERAQAALEQMRSDVKARQYDKAKANAAEAVSAAQAAIAAAGSEEARAKAKAESLVDSVTRTLPQVERLLSEAAKVKKAKLDLASAAAKLAAAKTALTAAQQAQDKKDYASAASKAGEAQLILADLQNAISASVQASTRKK